MHKYLIVIEKAKHNYSAYSPDVPGCIATGSTEKEVEQRMHLDSLRKDGLAVPLPTASAEYIEA